MSVASTASQIRGPAPPSSASRLGSPLTPPAAPGPVTADANDRPQNQDLPIGSGHRAVAPQSPHSLRPLWTSNLLLQRRPPPLPQAASLLPHASASSIRKAAI